MIDSKSNVLEWAVVIVAGINAIIMIIHAGIMVRNHRSLVNDRKKLIIFDLWPNMTSIIDFDQNHPAPLGEISEIANKLELLAVARLVEVVDDVVFDKVFKKPFINYCQMIAKATECETDRDGYWYVSHNKHLLQLYKKYEEESLKDWLDRERPVSKSVSQGHPLPPSTPTHVSPLPHALPSAHYTHGEEQALHADTDDDDA